MFDNNINIFLICVHRMFDHVYLNRTENVIFMSYRVQWRCLRGAIQCSKMTGYGYSMISINDNLQHLVKHPATWLNAIHIQHHWWGLPQLLEKHQSYYRAKQWSVGLEMETSYNMASRKGYTMFLLFGVCCCIRSQHLQCIYFG